MVFSLWVVSAEPASRKNITHEIMIWTDRVGQSPAGQRADSMSVDGTTCDVYIEKHRWMLLAKTRTVGRAWHS